LEDGVKVKVGATPGSDKSSGKGGGAE
jgi:hypothetical protein